MVGAFVVTLSVSALFVVGSRHEGIELQVKDGDISFRIPCTAYTVT
jgi:hypothetical protein